MKISSRSGIVWLLTGLNLVNYLDRYIVAAVSPRIQEEFGLNRQQTGWIASAFMIGYFLTSPIFGALGDRYARKWLIAGGVAVWSLATAGSGFAATFWWMLFARVWVGIGEASYATLSPTIIDDLAEPSTRNKWLAIFYMAIPIGSALGFVLGGQLEHHFDWRMAFYIAGFPGLLLAILALTIVEPARKSLGSASHKLTLAATAGLLRIRTYAWAVAGYTAYTFALGGFVFWAPQYLDGVLKMPLKDADFWFGAILVVAGFGGTALGGYLGDRWPGADRTKAYLRVCAVSSAIAIPATFACLLVGTPVLFFVAIGISEFALFTSTAPINAAVLRAVPEGQRASAVALSIFAIHLFGDLISPPLVGAMSDALGNDLRLAMFILPLAVAASAFFWWRGSLQTEVSGVPVAGQSPGAKGAT